MQIAVSEAKAKLSELVARAERGEEVVLTRRGAPAVRLVAQGQKLSPAEKSREMERLRTSVRERPADWQSGPVPLEHAPAPLDERWAMLEALWGSAKDHFGPDAARSADFLYDDFGLPA